MIVRDAADCIRERVIDHSLLCELLHPDKVDGTGDLGCSIAHAIVPPGESTLPHMLKKSAELYYILDGTGEMHIGSESARIRKDQVVYIPPGARQYISNTGPGDLVFLCIVAPKWQASDEEIVG